MHGFEALVAELLEAEGYWIRRNFRVALTKEDKAAIERPSSPRWEIDLLGYRATENLVLAVECKSYLDSPGVDLVDLQGGRYADRYKLFTEPKLREVVLGRLASDLVNARVCPDRPTVQLALAAGQLKSDPESLRSHFRDNGWLLFDPDWVRERLSMMAKGGYTNSVAAMVAKLLLRQDRHGPENDAG